MRKNKKPMHLLRSKRKLMLRTRERLKKRPTTVKLRPISKTKRIKAVPMTLRRKKMTKLHLLISLRNSKMKLKRNRKQLPIRSNLKRILKKIPESLHLKNSQLGDRLTREKRGLRPLEVREVAVVEAEVIRTWSTSVKIRLQ